MSFRRKSVVALLGVAVVVAAALVSVAVAGSTSNGPPQTRVYGGGNIPINSCTDGAATFCTGVTREFSILAIHDPNEDVTYGTITFGNPEIAQGVNNVVRVTCLVVSGSVADVGGVIVQSLDPSTIGGSFELFLRDSGQPGTVSRDGVSPIAPGPPAKTNCRGVSSDAYAPGFFTLTYGDIAIQKVGNQNG
jgi:hypothetical protein